MGRAIDTDKRLDGHERRLRIIEDALEELIQTRVHHVNLDNLDKHEEEMRRENGVTVEPDEEFTPPAGRRKKTTKKAKTVETT